MSDELIAGGSAPNRRGFGSDNQSPAHPAVLEAVLAANVGHVDAYGDDPWTQEAEETLAAHFGAPCTVAITFNGTGTNIAGLTAALDPWQAVICADTAHINTDECGAAEHVIGAKLYTCPTPDGKLTPKIVRQYFHTFGSEHHNEPGVISITNLTEMGTVYTPDEVWELGDLAHEHGMLLHMDGARIGNAAVACDCMIPALTGKAGVDIFSFGATKNAALGVEALVLSERVPQKMRDRIRYIRKQSLQLFSKQRFASAQMTALYGGNLWRECASHANEMAQALYEGAREAGVEFILPVQGNELFALLPKEHVASLQERFRFYTWAEDAKPGFDSIRWVCSWDTTPEDVAELVSAIKELDLKAASDDSNTTDAGQGAARS